MRNLLTTLFALSMIGALSTSVSANHPDARYLAKHHQLERKAVRKAFQARREAIRCDYRDARATINAARRSAARLCEPARRVVRRELDRRRSAELNAYRFAMRECDAEYRSEVARVQDEYRRAKQAMRRPYQHG